MSEKYRVTGRQIAAARALLMLSQTDLAESASISVATLKRMEANEGVAQGMANNVKAVVDHLEQVGIEFIPRSNAGGIGLRFRNPNSSP